MFQDSSAAGQKVSSIALSRGDHVDCDSDGTRDVHPHEILGIKVRAAVRLADSARTGCLKVRTYLTEPLYYSSESCHCLVLYFLRQTQFDFLFQNESRYAREDNRKTTDRKRLIMETPNSSANVIDFQPWLSNSAIPYIPCCCTRR